MSDELQAKIDSLTKENENLNNQLSMNSRGVEGLLIQLDAHKSMLNDNNIMILNLKTQVIALQKQIKQLTEKLKE